MRKRNSLKGLAQLKFDLKYCFIDIAVAQVNDCTNLLQKFAADVFLCDPFFLVDVMITNGGYGGVQKALAHGIPLIAAGKSEDKPEVCALIEYSGVGINLKTKTPTPTQIIKAFKQLMLNTNYQKKAQFIQSKMQSLDAPTIAVNLLQKLAVTKQPIFRND